MPMRAPTSESSARAAAGRTARELSVSGGHQHRDPKAVRDALFLSHFTALQMTYADLETLVVIAIAMGVDFRVYRSMTLRRLLTWTSVLFAIGDAARPWAATFTTHG